MVEATDSLVTIGRDPSNTGSPRKSAGFAAISYGRAPRRAGRVQRNRGI